MSRALEHGEPAHSFRNAVAAEVRAHLARRRISNRRFARMLGTTPAWVDRRLNGTTVIDMDDVQRFADALGMTPLELLGSAGGGTSRPTAEHVMRGDGAAIMHARSPRRRAVVIPFPHVRDVRPARAGTNGPGSSSVTTRDVAA